ncbi:MAG: WhiB family transcriptional regulator [Nitrososphaera sp.]
MRVTGDLNPNWGASNRAPNASRLDPKWRNRAACAGIVSRLYDPWDIPESMFDPPEDVLRVCSKCPVRIECLVDALKNNDDCVRGGTTKRQRDALKRPRRRVKCPACAGVLLASFTTGSQICVSCGLTWRSRD